ncbi:thiol:disulfide interchange protein TlpA [Terrihabitans rhizophilus]|jgi:thiol-disulfide isomerase/thioredoxin|uniref:TlpA disulfide reductase family protein n=1 Tax=Terrihabitans rhizophilus TaxID=3092662 RepID=A0ABU4RPL2_9HYPH|nr:TlpA disulfide reductase family protein [Terrihabitans sp. PJ23]MDX6806781.1 TlpA disulfide reductase family protein [Terrihabitans sp. PJ23]
MTDGTTRPKFPLRSLALVALLGAAIGVGAVYVKSSGQGNQTAAVTCAGNTEALARMKPLARGEVAGVVVPDAPRPVPDLAFQDANGQQKRLADFAGKTVLLNIWATWCAPCRHEMPALDRLQAALGGERFEVVTVSIDSGSTQKSKDFLSELKISNLGFYADPEGGVFQKLKQAGRAVGLPTTLIVDGAGCEIGYLPGPAEWDHEDGQALIRAALGEPPNG